MRKQKVKDIRKILAQKNETEASILKARERWKFLGRKRMFIRMMKNMDEDTLDCLQKAHMTTDEGENVSRFIILPNNIWNLYRNNFSQIVAIIYIFVAPYVIVSNQYISK